jgi:hypothetical protein
MGIQAICLRLFRRFRSDQSGQSLIIVAIAMTAVVAITAFAIDAAGWYERHHQAQVVADAAALAAANCLANPGHSSSININGTATPVPACTSGTDATDATTVADDYAAANGVTIVNPTQQVQVNTTSDTVTVSASATSPSLFASMFGIHTTTQTAGAQAGWQAATTTSATCSTPGAGCSAIYAGYTPNPVNSTTCSEPGAGLVIGTQSGGGAGVNVAGGIHTESELASSNGTVKWTSGSPSFTLSGTCYSGTSTPTTWWQGSSGTVALAPTAVASQSWPVDYSQSPYFSACTTTCTSVTNNSGGANVSGVPPYCTNASTASSGITFNNSIPGDGPIAGTVYCAIGSGTPSNPATWNGTITISYNVSTCQNNTFIGGNVILTQASVCLNAASNGCLMYATTGNITINQTTSTLNGTLFAPGTSTSSYTSGIIALGTSSSGAALTMTGLVEGVSVDMQNLWSLNMTGDGPPPGGSTSTTTGGSDSLSQ